MKLLVALVPLVSPLSEDDCLKRISSHLVLRDVEGAVKEAKEALTLYPQSEKLKIAYIQALAKSGYGSDALATWKEIDDTQLLETIAWSFLEKGEHSHQLFVTLFSMLGASHTSDVRAVRLIISQLKSSNAFLRSVGVKLAVQFRDAQLIDELRAMLKKETVWYVRLELIDALGKLGVKDVAYELQEIVASDRATIEERSASAEALIHMLDSVNPDALFLSKRAGLRYLACEIVAHLDMIERCPHVATLLSDTSPHVRIAALRTLALLGEAKKYKEAIFTLTNDSHAQVSITAAWALMRFDRKRAEAAFEKWLMVSDTNLQRVAAAAITKCGKAGRRLAVHTLKTHVDPYVRVTIAYGLMGQGYEEKLACQTIYDFLHTQKEKIMSDKSLNPHFEYLAPSVVVHSPQMVQYPSYVDQHTRLHLLNILALKRHPKAEKAVKNFLRERIDGLTYIASMTLLEEGESDALPLIKELLHDEDDAVRVQAALVLALTAGDKEAAQELQNAYPTADRDTKIHILGVLGHLGEKTSIPFLTEQLEQPFQLLRLVAASALIQCLYH